MFGFAQISKSQQQALASLLLLDPNDPQVLFRIGRINSKPDGSIRHGHCIMRDYRDATAMVQLDMPSQQVLDLLDTSPDAYRGEDEEEEVKGGAAA